MQIRPTLTASLLLLVFSVASVGAQDKCPSVNAPDLNPLPTERYECYKARLRTEAMRPYVGPLSDETIDEIFVEPNVGTPNTAGASPTTGTTTNLLPLASLAIEGLNGGDADEQAKPGATINLSPFPIGKLGDLNLTVRVVEATPSTALINTVEGATKVALEKALDDGLDTATESVYGFTFGLQWGTDKGWADGTFRLGRHPMLYEKILAQYMAAVWPRALGPNVNLPNEKVIEDCVREAATALNSGPVFDPEMQEIQGALSTCTPGDFIAALQTQAGNTADISQALANLGIDDLAAMISNQPQLVLTGSLHDRLELSGPDEYSFNLQYERGWFNLSSALRKHKKEDKSILEAVQEVAKKATESQHRAAFSVNYTRRDAYAPSFDFNEEVTDLATDMPVELMRTASLNLEPSDEWCFRASYSRAFPKLTTAQLGAEAPPDLEISVEGIFVDNDPTREKERVVAKLSYLLPTLKNGTIPFSITYANKAEFLGDQDHVFGAHVGISYKLGKPD